jgi:hypothetical protein
LLLLPELELLEELPELEELLLGVDTRLELLPEEEPELLLLEEPSKIFLRSLPILRRGAEYELFLVPLLLLLLGL